MCENHDARSCRVTQPKGVNCMWNTTNGRNDHHSSTPMFQSVIREKVFSGQKIEKHNRFSEISVKLINACSVRNKCCTISDLIADFKTDSLYLTETQLNVIKKFVP